MTENLDITGKTMRERERGREGERGGERGR